MRLDESPHLTDLRRELRSYFGQLLDDDITSALADPERAASETRRVVRQMGRDGWLGIGWPEEWGGRGRGLPEQMVFFDEVARAGAPYPLVTLNTVGPTLMVHGTDEQRRRYLPEIIAGEKHFAIGYTEADAGTDLAALSTRALRDGDEYVIDGAKVFTTGAELADHVWLACRTDPNAERHAGISILIVDTDAPGFSWSPIHTVGSTATNMTYYDGVRVPARNLVGDAGQGWSLITTQLNHERVTLGANCGLAFELFDEVRRWAATTPSGKRSLLEEPWVRTNLARAHARLEAIRLLNWQMTSKAEVGEPGLGDSAMVKVFSTEGVVEVYRLLLDVTGAAGLVPRREAGAILKGRLERAGRHAQINTFGGGVNEIQRGLVAKQSLGIGR